jgi:hypothetical protein
VDIDLFTEIRRIEDALARHSCAEALAWCNENKTVLRKIKVSNFSLVPYPVCYILLLQNTLEFDLRLQEYIELSRARKTMDAIAYSKKHLISWQDTHLAQIQQASTLLAFPPTTTCGPYKVFPNSSPIISSNIYFLSLASIRSFPLGDSHPILPCRRLYFEHSPYRTTPPSRSLCWPGLAKAPVVLRRCDKERGLPRVRKLRGLVIRAGPSGGGSPVEPSRKFYHCVQVEREDYG